MNVTNAEVRIAITAAGLKNYQVAKELGIFDTAFSRSLREELPQERKEEIFSAIANLTATDKENKNHDSKG
jgi:predicted transcriptional regulator